MIYEFIIINNFWFFVVLYLFIKKKRNRFFIDERYFREREKREILTFDILTWYRPLDKINK